MDKRMNNTRTYRYSSQTINWQLNMFGEGAVFVPGMTELHLCQLLAASSPVTLGVAVAAPWHRTWFNLLSNVTRMGSCIHQVFADNVLQCKYQKSQHWQLMHSAENVFFFDFIVWTQVPVHRIFEASITSLYPLVEAVFKAYYLSHATTHNNYNLLPSYPLLTVYH